MSGRAQGALSLLSLAVVVGACALPTWVTATGTSALAGEVAVRVPGGQAAPVVPATALVLAAAGVALLLAGRAGRWVVAAVVLAGGVALAVAAGAVLADPASRAVDAVATQTGVGRLTGPARLTAWPGVTLAVGVLAVVVAVLLARSSARWSAPSRRHEVAPSSSAPVASPAPDERSDWDALTRGSDPSEDGT